MSNLLRVAMIDLISSLHRQGLSQRRIAIELGINRETVARYLSQARDAAKPANAPSGSIEAEAEPKPANAPSGSMEAGAEPKPANAPPGSATPEQGTNSDLSPPRLVSESVGRRHGRRSECEPWPTGRTCHAIRERSRTVSAMLRTMPSKGEFSPVWRSRTASCGSGS